jgi:hypothetical protein
MAMLGFRNPLSRMSLRRSVTKRIKERLLRYSLVMSRYAMIFSSQIKAKHVFQISAICIISNLAIVVTRN